MYCIFVIFFPAKSQRVGTTCTVSLANRGGGAKGANCKKKRGGKMKRKNERKKRREGRGVL